MYENRYDVSGFICSSKTPETDKTLYHDLKAKALVLLAKGQEFSESKEEPCQLELDDYACQYASGSTLHRGYYCPSPVREIIVGNTKRGNLLKRITKRSMLTHKYIFNKDAQLSAVENYYNDQICATEYLQRCDGIVYGFEIDKNGHIYAVSEECYQDDVLKCYTVSYYQFIRDVYSVIKTQQERYQYDDEGLYECEFIVCDSCAEHIQRHQYRFVRKDGYLASFYAINDNGIVSCEYVITPTIRVKA